MVLEPLEELKLNLLQIYIEQNLNITNEAVLYYKNGGNNADKDSLFLILTPLIFSAIIIFNLPPAFDPLISFFLDFQNLIQISDDYGHKRFYGNDKAET